MPFTVIAHGGASSLPEDADGPAAACEQGLRLLRSGASPLQAAVHACVCLEDDPRFNAGTGSNLRLDGRTIEMDASCMTSDGKYGAVACLRDVRNPVLVAQAVHASEQVLLAGDGALAFARSKGHGPHDPLTTLAQRKFEAARKFIRLAQAEGQEVGWSLATLRRSWNYDVDLAAAFGESDTVGVLATDGTTYAGASSTGGTISTLLGRVGDVPMPGSGLFVGPDGAVAVTGDGDFLARKVLSHSIYTDLGAGTTPQDAVGRALAMFPDLVDVGVILLHGDRHAAGSNRSMAWAVRTGGEA